MSSDVEEITYNQTRKAVGGSVTVFFYDMTTMYFESREDEVRVPDWSKDGKNANPQVFLGLLAGPGGNPIGYEYILDARIRSQSEPFKEQVASLNLTNDQSTGIRHAGKENDRDDEQ